MVARTDETYVVLGRNTSFSATLQLSDLLPAGGGDGTAGFVLNGIDGSDNSDWSVSTAGDVNDDGVDDLIIGALGADPNGRSLAGETYIIYGRTTGFPTVLELSSLLPP